MIEIDQVSQVFQTSGRQNHLALSDISLTIGDGAFVAILVGIMVKGRELAESMRSSDRERVDSPSVRRFEKRR
jgi:ABC-type uncharacterized transport system ATPase component